MRQVIGSEAEGREDGRIGTIGDTRDQLRRQLRFHEREAVALPPEIGWEKGGTTERTQCLPDRVLLGFGEVANRRTVM
jgi:hypothetical protein